MLSTLAILPILFITTQVLASTTPDPIPLSIRSTWMKRAVQALSDLRSPCPFEAFGAVIVNHTGTIEGEEVCIGVNGVRTEGNPTLHGKPTFPANQQIGDVND
jgi:hypothetical protein